MPIKDNNTVDKYRLWTFASCFFDTSTPFFSIGKHMITSSDALQLAMIIIEPVCSIIE